MQLPLRMAATIRDLAQGGTRFKIVKHARQLREDFRRFATGDRPEVLLEGQRFEPLAPKQGGRTSRRKRRGQRSRRRCAGLREPNREAERGSTARGQHCVGAALRGYSLIFATTLLVRSMTVRPRSSFRSFFLVTMSLLSESAMLSMAWLMRKFIRVINCLPRAD